ncbi:hypothetical protein [Actinomadura sp. B10D3]|uniref:hypothetical protein n=1 Tax=Actinomadura sp. B10D3 TaxID=3153557 RepID=UPI00325C9846
MGGQQGEGQGQGGEARVRDEDGTARPDAGGDECPHDEPDGAHLDGRACATARCQSCGDPPIGSSAANRAASPVRDRTRAQNSNRKSRPRGG